MPEFIHHPISSLPRTRGNSPGPVHDKLERLLSVIVRLVRTGELPETARVRMRLPNPESRSPHCYTREQVGAIIGAAEELKLAEVGRVIMFLACTGVRINEALALRRDDISLEDASALVRHDGAAGRRTKPGVSCTCDLGKGLVARRRKWPCKNDLVFPALMEDRCVTGSCSRSSGRNSSQP